MDLVTEGENAAIGSVTVEHEERSGREVMMSDKKVIKETSASLLSRVTVSETEMLERLSKNAGVVAKSQQRGEPDMTQEEKLETLKAKYSDNPIQFLAKFGHYMHADDLACFDKLKAEGNYEAKFHLQEMAKCRDEGFYKKRLKNRRYEALKKLVETTDYFSEEEMQRRNPLLYEQLIGKYHTDEERAAFLQQSWKSTSGSGTTSMPLTDLFLAHLDRTSDGISCRRMAQETQQEEEDAAEAEYDMEEDDDCGVDSPQAGSSKEQRSQRLRPTVNDDPQQREEIDDDEKELLKEEFFTTMYRNFLNGKDEDFDYSTVDDNTEYDCGENLENDEEDKYFDDEEPCEVSEPSSDQEVLFKPPVRSSDIETRIEQLSVNQSSIEPKNQAVETSVIEEDEDELDVYMREIEKQLKK